MINPKPKRPSVLLLEQMHNDLKKARKEVRRLKNYIERKKRQVKPTFEKVDNEDFIKILIGVSLWGRKHKSNLYRNGVAGDMILTAGLLMGRRLFVFTVKDMGLDRIAPDNKLPARVKRVWDSMGVKKGLMTKTDHYGMFVYQLTEEGNKRAKEVEEQLAGLALIKIRK